jgi:hypothetical protein
VGRTIDTTSYEHPAQLFAGWEQPQLFAEELPAAFTTLR